MKPYGYVRKDGEGIFLYGEHQFQNPQAHDLVPVYTKREWVGLTEDEIKIAWAQLWYDLNHGKLSAPDVEVRNNVVVFGQALEAMLKEQNT